jgi:predicted alpha-1,2-mannosidase
MPSLHPGEAETEPLVDSFERRQPVAVTLSRAFDNWALSELAKDLGKKKDHEQFASRSSEYKRTWHPKHRLFMPKDSAGKWSDINPKSAGGLGFRDYFDENNGWTYAWLVQHDIPGLMELLGGPKAMAARLDQLFREPLGMKRSDFYVNGSNSTGMVGQFSMGNEVSFHIPYLYNHCGAPWKTQQRTRFLLEDLVQGQHFRNAWRRRWRSPRRLGRLHLDGILSRSTPSPAPSSLKSPSNSRKTASSKSPLRAQAGGTNTSKAPA